MHLSHLNPRQREAVEAGDGATLVLAGPGSGKTRVLTYRVAYLVSERQISPRRIMAVTFTNKAAREMKERLETLIGAPALGELTIGTFHAVCARILRVDGQHVGLERAFVIYDSDDQTALVKQAIIDLNLNDKLYRPGAMLAAISTLKNDLIEPDDFTPRSHREEVVRRVYARYQAALTSANAVDFDDLLMKTALLLQKNPAVLARYRQRYAHILVDEFQDTNSAQYLLVKLLAGPDGNLFVVGDEDQCLPAGTTVMTPSGPQPIETLEAGAQVIAAHGRGACRGASVELVRCKPYHGPLVEIVTQRGHHLRATPNHMLFARMGSPTDRHYVYLMYRRDKGYRIGLVQSARSDGIHSEPVSGLQQRGNQEHADKLWLLKVCQDRAEAQYYESYYAARYGLPMTVFHTEGRKMALGQAWIDRLYSELDTEARALALMADRYIYFDYPHHRPKGVAGERLPDRIALNLIMFSDTRRYGPSRWNAHRVTLNTTDRRLQAHLEAQGYATRPGRRDTWRWDGQRVAFKEAEALAVQVAEAGGQLEIARLAFLTQTTSAGGTTLKFNFQPASHIHPTMTLPVMEDGRIVDDEVVTVDWVNYEGMIFDLDVAGVHNYVAEGIVVHNSIYSWRGADFRNVMRFREDYPEAQLVVLEQNYRSTGAILDAAHGVIQANIQRHPKALWTENDRGAQIVRYEAYNEGEEADYVVGEIQRLVARKQARLGEIAVMYRTNAQSRVLEDAFVRRSVPYKLVGATRFYERREVKDALAYLRLAHNPNDTISLRRVINVPTRGIGDKTVAALLAWAERLGMTPYGALTLLRAARSAAPPPLTIPPPFDRRAESALLSFEGLVSELVAAKHALDAQALLNLILERTEYEATIRDGTEEGDSRWENVLELRTVTGVYAGLPPEESLPTFLEEVALVADVDEIDSSRDSVTLMTLHAAKGLEFSVVFLIGLEEEILPHKRSMDEGQADALEEERRLLYVGMTRARARLYLVNAFRRTIFGASNLTNPSRFLKDIPSQLVQAHVSRSVGSASRPTTPSRTGRQPIPFPSTRDARPGRGGESGSASGGGRNAYKLGEGGESESPPVLFRPGDKVTHPMFGEGTVLNSKPSRGDEEVEVIFKGGAKRLLGSYLTRVDTKGRPKG
ncbi:MAG: UvrD-helicase domain-containing protein [Anaerolineae bacterium]